MSKIIPIFESRTNEILSQISDFEVELQLDDKNIDGYIKYNDNRRWALEMTSGMERFISSMALRIALNSISNNS
jgi:DNA repair exonuclease SbcCD ATPase subunit